MKHRLQRRRSRLASAGIGAMVTVLALSVLTGETTAHAVPAPQRVLQVVNLDLGSDGSLYGAKDVVVRKAQDGSLSTDTSSVAPSRAVGDLPVRVLTSYRTAKGSGTDLKDLKGYTGRVEVDVTVQNTTVRPEQLSYDSAGRTKTAYALVGAPLTVVASANLGKHAIAEVVTSADSGAVTNGALSQDKQGNGTVQWASLLAPPQLAPSTTFTLVMDAKKFSLPSLNLSVQPGLAADPSIGGLMRDAFSDNPQSDLALQQQTISLISRVNGVLAESGRQLLDVRSQLDYSAGTLGDATIADLKAGTSRVADSTRELAAALQQLASSLGQALQQSQSQTLQTLQTSVERVESTLGDTSSAPPKITTSGAGCLAQVQKLTPAGSVYGQIAQVAGLLTALGGANGNCAAAISTSLKNNIGQLDTHGQPTNCNAASATPSSALCAISSAADTVTQIAGKGGVLDTGLASARNALDGLDTATAQNKLDGLIAQIQSLQTDAGKVTGFDALKTLLNSVNDLISGDGDGAQQILDNYDQLQTEAKQRLTALTGVDPDNPNNPPATQSVKASLDALDAAIAKDADTSNNANLTGPAGDLRGYFNDEVDAWKKVVDATSPTGDEYQRVHGFIDALTKLKTTITAQLDDAGNIKQVQDDASALYTQPTETVTDQNGNPVTQPIPLTPDACNLTDDQRKAFEASPAASVQLAFYDVQCAKKSVDDALVKANSDAKNSVLAAAGGVRATLPVVDASRQLTSAQLNQLFAQASKGYGQSAAQVLASGKSAVGKADGELVAGRNSADSSLNDLVRGSLTTINSSVSSSTRDLNAAADVLSKDLSNVLADLGSKQTAGSGLLGVVQAQAAQTRTSAATIARASGTADSFSNVRAQDVDGIFLQNAQLRAALAEQAALPPFALTLPQGSRHTTVYAFHVRGVS